MADKDKFIKPELKTYSAKKLLTQDRLMNAMIGIREIQTQLWKTMPDDQYEKLEPEFDTAIAAMMAHMCGVMPAHAQPDQEKVNRRDKSMNKVILMGRLTRDPQVRYTQGQDPMAIARFTLAVDKRGRKQEGQQDADFPSCVAFGKSAEFVEKYVHQGTKIVLTGRIQTGSYTNKDNIKVYTTEVIAEDIEFAESKAAAEGSGGAGGHQKADQTENDGFMNIPEGIDEELPFN